MKKFYNLIFLSVIILFSTELKAQVNTQDSLALVDLYNSTNGPHWWHKWYLNGPVASWYGVTITSNRVTGLYLYDNQLSGTIPSSMGNLTELESLDLEFNNLSGDMSTFYNLSKLSDLDLNGCGLTGNISFLSKLPNPQGIYLGCNHLTGKIHILNCANLTVLNLSHNQLSGSIPIFRKDTASLYGDYGVSIILDHNNLSGNINKFDSIAHLSYLVLNDNQLTGRIPASLNKFIELNTLDLSYNQLSGTIPSLDSLRNLDVLALSNNQLSGRIPASFNNYNTQLEVLRVSNNNLGGTIPSLSNLNLSYIDLSYNQFIGKLPSFENFHPSYAYFENNQFSGKIPDSYGNFDGSEIDLSNNNLSGAVPSFLNSRYLLDKLNLQNNQLTFSGMENIAATFSFAVYSPQAIINVQQNGNVLKVVAGGTVSNNTYKWYKNGVLFKTKTGNASLTVNSNGNYSVVVTNSIATQLTLYSDSVAVTNLLQQNTLSSIEATGNNFSIYPNPVKSIATISFNAIGNCTIKLTDVAGNILQMKTIDASGKSTINLNMSKYSSGVYFVLLLSEGKPTQTLQLNKQ